MGRLRWRLSRNPHGLSDPPERPLGAKLELTYACNLRCGFCYTDSPRRTLQRSTDLPDDVWRQVVEETIELGIIEAVVTGGEPLLRKELTLDLIETLATHGVGVTLNSNGWFVDEEVAARLGDLTGVTVHVSVDGARPGLHDAQRGVPGSWRRAVEGIDRLLNAGVGVCVVHVVTPGNVAEVPKFLEQMWVLGVPWARVTPVLEIGAAARERRWVISRRALGRAVDEFQARRGTTMRIDRVPASAGDIALQGLKAPASILVRPNGDVLTDSLRPFAYGNATREGVAECWRAIRTGWRDARIQSWADSLRGPDDLPSSELIPYLDDEVSLASAAGEVRAGGSGRDLAVPKPSLPEPIDPGQDLAQAKQKIMDLSLARRYRLAPVRVSGDEDDRFIRRASDGHYLRLNGSGAAAMDALQDGTLADAAGALEDRYGIDSERAREDAVAALRKLIRGRVIVPAAAASSGFASQVGTSDLPELNPTGQNVHH